MDEMYQICANAGQILRSRTCKLFSTAAIVDMRGVVVLLDTLSLPLRRTFGNSLGEERQKLSDRSSLIEGEC